MATPDQSNQLTRDAVTPCLREAEGAVIAFRLATKNPAKLRTMRAHSPDLVTALERLSDIWGECE